MNVLMTTDTIGGVWCYALELARALNERGVRVTLATQGAPLRRDQRLEAEALPDLDLRESTFKLEWMDDPWDDVRRAGEWLLELEARVAPDIVHLNGFSHAALSWRAPALVVAHSCVLSWWRAVKGVAAPAKYAHYRAAVRAGLLGARAVVAPSTAMASALAIEYGPVPRIRVIRNGRDPSDFRPAAKEDFIFAAGRIWDEAKNLSVLCEAARVLPWRLAIAGDAAHPSGERVEIGGAQVLGVLSAREITDWYGRAAVYALPASYEPFGLSVLEAALSGCALVLGDLPSLREIWDDAALFVPPHDPLALRDALRRVITDETGRGRLALRAADRAREYGSARMGAAYQRLYGELVAAQADFPVAS